MVCSHYPNWQSNRFVKVVNYNLSLGIYVLKLKPRSPYDDAKFKFPVSFEIRHFVGKGVDCIRNLKIEIMLSNCQLLNEHVRRKRLSCILNLKTLLLLLYESIDD